MPSDGQKNIESKEGTVDGEMTLASKLEVIPKAPSEEAKLDDRIETTTEKAEEQTVEKDTKQLPKEKKHHVNDTRKKLIGMLQKEPKTINK